MYLEIYDSNSWFGENHLNKLFSVNENMLNGYLSCLKKVIKTPRVVLTNFFSLYFDPIEGDHLLGEFLKNNNGLFGSLIFPSFFIYKETDFEKYLIKKYNSGFRILRLFPKFHKYSIDRWAFNKIYSILDDHKFPIMITLDDLDITGNKAIRWDLISEISYNYKNIPLIIDGGDSKEMMYSGYFFELLNRGKNIYLETHNLLALNQIEDIIINFGSERLILGSYFPFFPEYLSLGRIIYSDLTKEDKNNIIYLNIKNIFERIMFD